MLANLNQVKTLQSVLRVIFGVVPIAAGFDKFFNLLTDWAQYIHPAIAGLLPVSATTFMHVAGIIEIAAGLVVLSRFTAFGAYLVSAWLCSIAVSLILSGNYLDVAVRDLVMSAAAYALAVLSRTQPAENRSFAAISKQNILRADSR